MTTAAIGKIVIDDDRARILQAYIIPTDVRDIPARTGLPVDLVAQVISSDAGYDRAFAQHLVEQFALQQASPATEAASTALVEAADEPSPHAPAPDASDSPEQRTDAVDDAEAEASTSPRIVVLCGSTRFRDVFAAINRELTLAGAVVLAPGVFVHADGVELDPQVKADLDALHLQKIDMADEVVVVAPGGDYGESTKAEIVYAEVMGKPVTYRTDDPPTVLRTWGSHLCENCDATASGPRLCCERSMVPVRVELHQRSA